MSQRQKQRATAEQITGDLRFRRYAWRSGERVCSPGENNHAEWWLGGDRCPWCGAQT